MSTAVCGRVGGEAKEQCLAWKLDVYIGVTLYTCSLIGIKIELIVDEIISL